MIAIFILLLPVIGEPTCGRPRKDLGDVVDVDEEHRSSERAGSHFDRLGFVRALAIADPGYPADPSWSASRRESLRSGGTSSQACNWSV
jgi:hypothetical protein